MGELVVASAFHARQGDCGFGGGDRGVVEDALDRDGAFVGGAQPACRHRGPVADGSAARRQVVVSLAYRNVGQRGVDARKEQNELGVEVQVERRPRQPGRGCALTVEAKVQVVREPSARRAPRGYAETQPLTPWVGVESTAPCRVTPGGHMRHGRLGQTESGTPAICQPQGRSRHPPMGLRAAHCREMRPRRRPDGRAVVVRGWLARWWLPLFWWPPGQGSWRRPALCSADDPCGVVRKFGPDS